jgi:hypothetical protein
MYSTYSQRSLHPSRTMLWYAVLYGVLRYAIPYHTILRADATLGVAGLARVSRSGSKRCRPGESRSLCCCEEKEKRRRRGRWGEDASGLTLPPDGVIIHVQYSNIINHTHPWQETCQTTSKEGKWKNHGTMLGHLHFHAASRDRSGQDRHELGGCLQATD